MRRRLALLALPVAATSLLAPSAQAGYDRGAGSVDYTYGPAAFQFVPVCPAPRRVAAAGHASWPGRGSALLVSCRDGLAQTTQTLLVRLGTDGLPDPAFSGDGVVALPAGVRGVALRPDGSTVVLVGGAGVQAFGPDGSAGAVVGLTTSTGTVDLAAIAATSGGGVVGAGVLRRSEGDQALAARLRPDLALDPGFDGDGLRGTDYGSAEAFTQVAATRAGGLVAAGTVTGAAGTQLLAARFTPAGGPDASFGGGALASPAAGSSDDLALTAAEDVLVLGRRGGDDVVARFGRRTGALDPAWAAGGTLTRPRAGTGDPARRWVRDLGVDRADRLVLLAADGQAAPDGSTQLERLLVERLYPDGTPDQSWRGGGASEPGVGPAGLGEALVLDDHDRSLIPVPEPANTRTLRIVRLTAVPEQLDGAQPPKAPDAPGSTAPPAPAPAPPAGLDAAAPADRALAGLRLRAPASARLGALRRTRRVEVGVELGEPGSLRLTARLGGRALAVRDLAVSADRSRRSVTLRLSRRAVRAITAAKRRRGGRPLALSLVASGRDGAGNTGTVRRTVRIT